MKSTNPRPQSDFAHPHTTRMIQMHSQRLFLRAGAILIFTGLLVSAFYSVSSASLSRQLNNRESSVVPLYKASTAQASLQIAGLLPATRESFKPIVPAVPQSGEMIETFASDCTTSKTTFVVGDTVCVKVSGIPLNQDFPRRLTWATTDSTIVRTTDITADPQTDSLLITATTELNGLTIDNRGTWQVAVRNPFFGFLEAIARFTVTDPANATADLGVASTFASDSVQAGSQAVFGLQVNNYGPDSSTNVQLTDVVPANSTFVDFVQTSGPAFTCTNPTSGGTGTTTCTIATLASGDIATFTATYDVNIGVPAGTLITNTADVSSVAPPAPATDDQNLRNNSTSASITVVVGGGGGSCTLNCPEDINAVANTTEDNQRGTHVTYDAAEPSGTCGAITATPASGSFFPVGTTTVSVTSETGGGSCSFTITVEDTGTNPPNISCPASQEANADSNCSAAVNVGTATATGDNVTIFATRSDGKPMYTCDANGTNCTRLSSDAPFQAGTTTITWIAHSHDVPGPYANEDDEIAHRTGAASCTQTVTVNDVMPPTITPPANQPASADETCQFALLDYTTMATVSDNCACASSDESETCDGREPITITQSPAPGTLVGLGPHTITLTANDGSSNNGGAGNTATVQFTVTVSDTTAPIITCPAPITTSSDLGQCSAVVNPGTATATDNCDNTPTIAGTRSDNQPLSAPYPVGATTITWTATDDANNQSSCTQTITVNDTELPTISCPASITLEPTCPTGAKATYTTPVGMDNCPGAITTRTAGLASGSVFPVGNTTVTYSVTDAHGNGPVSCSFTVTVLTPQAVLQNLINSVSASSLTGTQKNGLLAKLNAALSAINSGQTNVACNKLSEFVNSVQGLISHGDLTAAQGNAWISSANHVRNTIGCTNLGCS
jgi:uncharacterized repeat protein (TIGR01451 family)